MHQAPKYQTLSNCVELSTSFVALESRAVILCVPDVAAARRIRAVQAFDTSNMWQTVAIVILNVKPGGVWMLTLALVAT